MKKVLALILCILLLTCFAACSKKSQLDIGEYKTYEISGYSLELPGRYEFNDLTEVKAEPSCIAMLTDKEGEFPELWIYEDDCLGSSIKEHIKNNDEIWDFRELSIYIKDGRNVAKTLYDEDWYGRNLINEHYYVIGNNNKVLSFDFAYDDTDDSETKHAYVAAIAEALGF